MSFDPTRPATEPIVEDPRALRALAHPLRLEILGYLQRNGPATATECAEVTGQSPSACSWHLRELARYGLVGEADRGRGRRRPWQALVTGFGWDTSRPEGRAVRDVVFGRALETVHRYFEREDAEDPEWRRRTVFSQSSFFLTVDEMGDLRRELMAIVRRRNAEGAEPRAGKRDVQLLIIGVPTDAPA
jgi:DNA-binding transcriptional ArsR family regulator